MEISTNRKKHWAWFHAIFRLHLFCLQRWHMKSFDCVYMIVELEIHSQKKKKRRNETFAFTFVGHSHKLWRMYHHHHQYNLVEYHICWFVQQSKLFLCSISLVRFVFAWITHKMNKCKAHQNVVNRSATIYGGWWARSFGCFPKKKEKKSCCQCSNSVLFVLFLSFFLSYASCEFTKWWRCRCIGQKRNNVDTIVAVKYDDYNYAPVKYAFKTRMLYVFCSAVIFPFWYRTYFVYNAFTNEITWISSDSLCLVFVNRLYPKKKRNTLLCM